VYQVFLEDGRVIVTKFYRPGRWSNEQILEEHAFAAELEAKEIPVAAAWPMGETVVRDMRTTCPPSARRWLSSRPPWGLIASA